ncbi:hypothetical protein BN903_2 [Halorubrum sp. AJ67]|nr:hypothetical protein BN903_2 [Halorubrum sp. AJ67]
MYTKITEVFMYRPGIVADTRTPLALVESHAEMNGSSCRRPDAPQRAVAIAGAVMER